MDGGSGEAHGFGSFHYHKGLVITYGEGATIWENRGSKTFCGPPKKTG